jgi:hypothetical protein
LRRGLFAGDGLVDLLAHLMGTAAALGARSAGAEDVDRAASARAYGGVDVSFPDGSADANVHERLDPFSVQMRISCMEDKRHSQLGQGALKALQGLVFCPLSPHLGADE